MWWKLLLLTFYLVVLILLSRILDIFTYYQTGYLSNGLINPLSLTVQRLRAILEERGVSHRNVIEKSELTELVTISGEVTQRELEEVARSEGKSELEEFSSEAHFLEKVEDTKDSVWVVQVVRGGRMMDGRDGMGGEGMDVKAWRRVAKRLSKFGIQCGVLRCANDEKFCDRKGWHGDQIILSTPEGRCVKDRVVMRSLRGSLSAVNEGKLFDWVVQELSERLEKVHDLEKFNDQWLRFDPAYHHKHQSPSLPHAKSSSRDWEYSKNTEKLSESSEQGCQEMIRALFISNLTTAPLFFSVMAAKFSGRVKLGVINSRDHNFRRFLSTQVTKNYPQKHPTSTLPTNYLIITPHRLKSFGLRPGEHFNYRCLFGLFRSLHPETNDVFILSIIISTILSSLNLLQPSPSLHHHLLSTLFTTTKHISLLLITWLIATNLTIPPSIINLPLSLLRVLCLSDITSLLREDFSFYLSSTMGRIIIIITLTIVISLYNIISYKQPSLNQQHTSLPPSSPSVTTSCIHLIENIMEGICRGLFQNSSTPPPSLDHDDHYAMIIQRLAVPDLWLRPLISPQYLHDLPLWRWKEEERGVCDGGWNKVEGSYGEVCGRCREDRSKREVKEAALMLMDGDYSCKCGGREEEEEDDEDSQHDDGNEDGVSFLLNNLRPLSTSPHPPHGNLHQRFKRPHQPQDTSGAPRGIIASSECSICLDLYKGGDLLCGLPCYHAYHQRCIMDWLSRDNHCCPICRWPSYRAKPCPKHVIEQVAHVSQE